MKQEDVPAEDENDLVMISALEHYSYLLIDL